MNTNRLRTFAQQTRTRLLEAVEDKLTYVLNADSVVLRDYAEAIEKLKKDMAQMGSEALIDKVAYTWFNRLMALRFMDANDYQPLRLMVISPKEGFTQPEILEATMQGHISDELLVDRERIYQLLDGKILSNNPQNEIYRMLLIASCNYLHSLFPFLFEEIVDYTELLLPDDLISELSIINDFVEGMNEEDCQHTEMIGWLYQFYISDRKDEVFATKGKVSKEDIPAATQLFTPRWIVEYMVQNTVGKLWVQNNPHSTLRSKMPYYIETEASTTDDYLIINSPEELTLLDQACGSGHILVYGFELFYHIYEEAGYTPTQIPQLIIENNLYGYEIDERAAQLASFSLLMKARSYHRRLFHKPMQPTVLCFHDLDLSEMEIENVFEILEQEFTDMLKNDLLLMQQATNLGSLIQPCSNREELSRLESLLAINYLSLGVFVQHNIEQLFLAVKQLRQLGEKFCCVVDNPPYMRGGRMNKSLADFVRIHYSLSKADLMACFMESGLSALKLKGMLGMINQHSWMFLSGYEKLREELIKKIQFDTLLHLGPRAFPEIGGEVVQNASFTFINKNPKQKSSYIRLVDYKDSITKSEKTLEAINSPNCGWLYIKKQKDFEKITGSSFGYWLSDTQILSISEDNNLFTYGKTGRGLQPTPTVRFVRFWYEAASSKSFFPQNKTQSKNEKWFAFTSGGSFRKWFGNYEKIVNWENDGRELKANKAIVPNEDYYFKLAIIWNMLTSSDLSIRVHDKGLIPGNANPALFLNENSLFNYITGLLNCKVIKSFLDLYSATMNANVGDFGNIPIRIANQGFVEDLVLSNIENSREEWNSRETSWDFLQNELIRFNGQDLEEAIDLYKMYWSKQFYQLHQNEEELNKEFIEIYGLQNELTPDVPLDEITILRDELKQKKLKTLSEKYQSSWQLKDEKWILENRSSYPKLPFNTKELIVQFISYAVGCMFGRYSLDREGLILANQGETLADFLQKMGKSTEELKFIPDKDNVIPVLEGEWFADDIVIRFREFVKSVWDVANLDRNINYIEKLLGKPLRAYFYSDFYTDHIKRYKKRPIYWMISSPSGTFQALIYLHRYNQDTLNNVLNDYLRPYTDKLENHKEHLKHIAVEGSQREKTQAQKDIVRIEKMIDELRIYDKEVIYPLAINRISIDLDDGVLVNFNKFGKVLKTVTGLNDTKAKKKVKDFDWIDVGEIR